MRGWSLESLGWRAELQNEHEALGSTLDIGRVAIEFGGLYRVLIPERPSPNADAPAEVVASLPGKWRAEDPVDTPAVGDWVGLRRSGDSFAIEHRFTRRTRFLRQAAGRRTQPQVVGANIDVVFVVTSLDHDFNPRRIERYLTAILDGGADPVIVLSKADLSEDPDAARAALDPSALTTPIEIVSAERRMGLDRLLGHLGPGRTGALTGSSGVGKSTLVNALIGRPRQRTHGVRGHDSKGRHTTTHRELILLAPDQGILVDTPGMRELQLWTPGDGLERAFEDIQAWAEQCRFRDCGHKNEPGCAVRAAVDRGELSATRKASYLKLKGEEARQLEQAEAIKQRGDRRKAGRAGREPPRRRR